MHRSFLARHVKALAAAALVLDVVAVVGSHSFAVSVLPGWHQPILAPAALPWVIGLVVLLLPLHALLVVAVWRRLRHGREPSSRLST